MTTALRHRHMRLLQDVLGVLDRQSVRLPDWSADEVASMAEVSGLVPLAGALGMFASATADVRAVVAAERTRAADDVARVRQTLRVVLDALTAAAVPHVLVGGAAMLTEVWERPECRPTATVEVVTTHHVREQAASALGGVAAALDPGVEVVVHDGWTEHVHGFEVEGFAVEPATFDHAALTAYAIGRLSAAVVRGDVRGVQVVDVWACLARDVDWVRIGELMAHADPRLTGPGLWFLHRLEPGLVREGLLPAELARLPHRAHEVLHEHHALDVLHDPSHPPSVAWSTAFAETLRERKATVSGLTGARRRGGPRRS